VLPRVIASSVVRSAHQGQSHGGVYLIDFETGATRQAIDWDDPTISWEGRGEDRGLRGIALHGGQVYLAASDEIFVYDPSFRLVRSLRNPYLKHTHEIFIQGDMLYATSTGFDSILGYDLSRERFVSGLCLRFGIVERLWRKMGKAPLPELSSFDPEGDRGPGAADSTHVNNVFVHEGATYASGRALGHVVSTRGGRASSFARVPYGTHNARPYREGVLFNHTGSDRLVHADRGGHVLRSWPIVHYDPGKLEFASLGPDQARQAFGRGLAVLEDEELLVAGSSPATVTLYGFDRPEPLKSINLTMDVRNAIHGLEVWPYD
jgi:hypothetical protein